MKTLSIFDFGVGCGNCYFRFGALAKDKTTKAVFGIGLMGYRLYLEAFGLKPNVKTS